MTSIRFYAGVPWSYGAPHIKYTTNKLSYLHTYFEYAIHDCNVGKFRQIVVPKSLLDIQHCNYCHFQVNGVDYFCFIMACEYVNENATRLQLQPDWLFMYIDSIIWKKCLIERHHYAYDSTNMIRTSEGFNPPLDVFNTYYPFNSKVAHSGSLLSDPNWAPVVFTNIDITTLKVDTTLPSFTPGLVNSYRAYEVTNCGDFSKFLNGLDNPEPDPEDSTLYLPEHILGIVYVPKIFITRQQLNPKVAHGMYELAMNETTGTFTIPEYNPYFQGYTPINRKMTYSPEFTYIEMTDGFSNKVKLDRSKMNSYQFKWTCIPSPDFTVKIIPVRYNNEDYPEEYSITITNFPQASWNSDTYKIFMLNNKNQLDTSQSWAQAKGEFGVMNNATGAVANALTGNIGGIHNSLTNVATSMLDARETVDSIQAKIRDASHSPVQTKGNINSLTSFLGRTSIVGNTIDKFAFLYFNYCGCNFNDAQSIDNYFTHYGYKFNREETPSPTHRSTYTYYKLLECNYLCDCNNEARAYIDSLLMNGITFWNGNEVYQYE